MLPTFEYNAKCRKSAERDFYFRNKGHLMLFQNSEKDKDRRVD